MCTKLLLRKVSINFEQFLFLSSKDYKLSCYTFLHHTLIICTLFNSHMIIRILISLMIFREKFCFYIFYYFLNWPLEIWFTHPMWTYNLCMWIKFAPLYKNVTLAIQDKCTYKRCTRFPFVEDFNRFWTTFSFFVIQWLHTHMPHITS